MTKLMERCLLWLHEQEIVTLGKGLTVFRSAMTVHLDRAGGRFTQGHFLPLEEHYREKTIQTHVMAAYAERGLGAIDDAQRMSKDYFSLDGDNFLRRWLPGRGTEIRRQTTGASWQKIVEGLGNRVQQDIVTDDREQTNVLVLAGPGSGKTRVLVHRIAYLLRMRREDPREILVLAYNRHAAAEIRVRLRHLVGEAAGRVTVSTCHALAMRLVGASFTGTASETRDFDGIVMEAVRQLEGHGLTKSEAEAQRDALIQGYRWILVDEYQDIGPEEYALIAAVAGRSLEDPELRLSLFAVGDDDQNVYAFKGAKVAFIRKFEEDYRLGLPVEMANETLPSIWRLREMQTLVAGLRADPARLFGVPDLLELLNRQPGNRWTGLIAEGVADLARELGPKTMPATDLVEWFGEWSRDTRGEQRGLLLLTAHRSKGLEFDHVVILNGGWDRGSRHEDADAPRRLFYVVMTRARRTLAVMTTGQHRFVPETGDGVLRRNITVDPRQDLSLARQYQLPNMTDVDLSYAGRQHDRSGTLTAIAGARVGDGIGLIQRDGKWDIVDETGRILGRMAKAWSPPDGLILQRGQVGAVIRWRKMDNEEDYRRSIKRDEWETILPELIFGPGLAK